MVVIYLLLLIGAALCFALAASGKVASKVNLTALGLLLWVAVPLIKAILQVAD